MYIFFFNDTATTEIYTLSLHDALPILKDIQKSSDRDDFPSMGDILRLPDIVVNGDQKDENELKTVFLSVLNKTISEVEVNRLSEGKNIKTDLSMRLELLIGLVGEIRKKSLSDRKSTRLNSSHKPISYAVFCLKKKNNKQTKLTL